MASSNSGQLRSKKGCLVCKTRKVKCDEIADGCGNCEKLGVRCPGYLLTPGESLPKDARTAIVGEIFKSAGVSKRAVGSCQECRSAKYRCSRERPQCRRCRSKCFSCNYDDCREPRSSHRGSFSQLQTPIREDSTSDLDRDTAQVNKPDEYEWLYSEYPPDNTLQLRLLADTYFNHIHPLRSLSFIHRPTFMQALDHGQAETNFGSALVYIIFALAARHIKPDSSLSSLETTREKFAGGKWAKKAQNLSFQNMGVPSIRTLMALLLLCEYENRHGRNSTLFMLSGCCFRMAQVLRLNSEVVNESIAELPTSSQITERESRRRLMWSCYILDIVVGSGVEGHVMSTKDFPRIQLPCSSQAFNQQLALDTGYLTTTEHISPVSSSSVQPTGIEAYFVRVIHFRGQILSLIREEQDPPEPWLDDSEFASLNHHLDTLESMLPSNLRFGDLNIYIAKDQNQLGAFFALYFIYHQCYCDLNRVVLPGYQFPITKTFAGAPTNFIRQCQNRCQQHAAAISRIVKLALNFGHEAFADPLCGICIYESTKIQVIYATTDTRIDLWNEIAQNIQSNLTALELMELRRNQCGQYIISLCRLLKDFSFTQLSNMWQQKVRSRLPPLSQSLRMAPEFAHLHSLAIYQLAWKEISELNTSQRQAPHEGRPPSEQTSVTPQAKHCEANLDSQVTDSNVAPSQEFNRITTDSPSWSDPADIGVSIEMLTTDQYLQMAEGIHDYLTWDPLIFDTDNMSNFAYQ